MQLCDFHCIIWHSIYIQVIFPIYLLQFWFRVILCGPQGVSVAKKYQMGPGIDISSSYYQE